MKTLTTAAAIALCMLCSSCDRGREAELEAQISKLEESQESLEAKVLEQDATITELTERRRQALLETERLEREVVAEVRDRLAGIESDYAEVIDSEAEIEEIVQAVSDAEGRFFAEAKEAAEKRLEVVDVIQSTDPFWDLAEGGQWGSDLADLLVELRRRNDELERELIALKTGKTPAKSPTENGAEQPAAIDEPEPGVDEEPVSESGPEERSE